MELLSFLPTVYLFANEFSPLTHTHSGGEDVDGAVPGTGLIKVEGADVVFPTLLTIGIIRYVRSRAHGYVSGVNSVDSHLSSECIPDTYYVSYFWQPGRHRCSIGKIGICLQDVLLRPQGGRPGGLDKGPGYSK